MNSFEVGRINPVNKDIPQGKAQKASEQLSGIESGKKREEAIKSFELALLNAYNEGNLTDEIIDESIKSVRKARETQVQ